MRIIVVDDERLAVEGALAALGQLPYKSERSGFTNPAEALEHFRKSPADVAFLDIQIGRESGLTLAKSMKDINPGVRVVFLTGYPQYAGDAFHLRASGYVMKPVTPEKLRVELEALLHPLPPLEAAGKRVRVQCFGSFEIFADGKPLPLARAKSKELMAFLVDRRGSAATMAEIASVLWEDGQYSFSRNKQIHNFIADLAKSLSAAGAGDILLRGRNSVAVNTALFDCDYYACLSGDPAAINAYNGEYMSQYSWSEFTTGELTRKYS